MANTQINLYRGDTPPTDTTALWFNSSAYVLSAPTGGSVTAGDTQITLHPGTVTGAGSYNAYYTSDGTDPTKSSTKLTGVTDNQVVNSLTNGTLYKFVFTAIDINGESAVSAVVSATPQAAGGDTTAPTVTAFDVPATTNGLTVTISTFTATDAVGVTGYMVTESATPPSAGDAGWSGIAPTTYTATTNGAKTLYGYAKDAAGNVSTGVSDTTTITTAPNAATGLSATNGNTESVITWTASATDSTHSAPTSYNLRWKLSTDGTYTTVTGVTSPYTKTGLTNGSTYNFIIDAVNSAGTTSTSAVNATPSGAVTQLSDTFTGTNGTELSTHTSDSGHTYSKHPSYTNNAVITSNILRNTDGVATAGYKSNFTPASADYTVKGNIIVKSTIGFAGVLGRLDATANTFYMARYNATGNQWELVKFVAGSSTTLGSSAESLLTDTPYEVKLVMSGTSISLYKKGEGSPVIGPITDSAITSAGTVGVRIGACSDTTGIWIDDLATE